MPTDDAKDALERLLKHVDISRRSFVRKFVGGTFTVPLIASFSLDRLGVPGAFAQVPGPNIPGPNIPGPNIPGPNIPGPNIPGPNIPGPNIPGPNIPGPNIPARSEHTLFATADATLRNDARNVNEGRNPRLRVGVRPLTRTVIQFDNTQIAAVLGMPGFTIDKAMLVVTVETNHHSWGQFDDRTVDARPLLESFVEGNGRQIGLAGSDEEPGTGAGVTWNSPTDPNVTDAKRSRGPRWNGGNFGDATAPGAIHTNALDRGDEVSWDVTADVLARGSRWLLKLTDEKPAAGGTLPLGFEHNVGSTIEYYSRDGALMTDRPDVAPKLQITGTLNTGPTS
jgi:hypothetical protein